MGEPSLGPSFEASHESSDVPSTSPIFVTSSTPSLKASYVPSNLPTLPTILPTITTSEIPTHSPTHVQTKEPTNAPTRKTFCCAWAGICRNKNPRAWCNRSKGNCEGPCNGEYIDPKAPKPKGCCSW